MAGKRNPWGKPQDGAGDGGNDGGDGGDGAPSGEGSSGGPRNPWLPGGGDGSGDRPRRSASIEDIFKNRGPEGPRRAGGGGGGPSFRLPERPGGGSWFPLAIAGIAAIYLFITSVHQVAPREQGIVTYLGGKYADTLDPGLHLTMPWPLHTVAIENVSQIRLERIPDSASEEKLILTADQNLVDLSYLVRWNINDLALYRYQLADPNDTMTEVAEAAMRAAVAEQDLDTVLTGEGRANIELNVRTNMQAVLDALESGIAVQGIEIEKTDAPQQVIEAFNDVLAARQDAERDLNEARRYEQQLLAQAQGDAAAFNNIYEEYRLAPEVTRQRLYYETMENVLAKTDKTIVETDGVATYLPLPEIRRRARESAAAQNAGGQ
ncbi:protease modulator HflK [Alteraurantiacibacter aquimixticola]|uniref:Protease modulator HflK n=1 Tax=Alteraurantiacibacter aquimixticola TaxID=2489173 RepID=A0A4T3F495_9SPHN|nr:protease modulator HflK [Alteraurantiacibacter aquimixticola]TIX49523.1 protease modulator HflK [Alteraurantiacibacter aquimixticola]